MKRNLKKSFKIYGGTAKVVAIRLKSKAKKLVNKTGYNRKYPKKLASGKIIMINKKIKPYKRSLAGTIKRLKIVETKSRR